MTGEEWILQNAGALAKAKIEATSLSTELSRIEGAWKPKQMINVEDLLNDVEAPQERPLHANLMRAPKEGPSLKALDWMTDKERTIYYGIAAHVPQYQIAKQLGRTQGAVSHALKALISKLRRLKILLAYDFEPALAKIRLERHRDIARAYTKTWSSASAQRLAGAHQPLVSNCLNELKSLVPAKVWEAVDPKHPLAGCNFGDRTWKATHTKESFNKAMAGLRSGKRQCPYKGPRSQESIDKMIATRARNKAALKAKNKAYRDTL